ncbi:MAG TPA: monofunctional biosynthetic peptidoglycan transglycosylase [Burkholderiales bacterium]|nr:monofunctional biosynthetic peptidoglycan transglycosylase [Burkholderiales bacterium]
MRKKWRWSGRLTLLVLSVVLLYQLWIFAHVVWWNFFNPSASAFMQQRLVSMQQKDPKAKLRHSWVGYSKVSLNLKRALVVAEDANFMEHEGFDWDAIQRAYAQNLKKGRVVAGGSTISQQLAKNLFLSGRRTALRKLQEALITVMIEAVMSKRRIFEIYLNIIEWGDGVFGAEAASRHYFKKSAANLDAWDAAYLAAMVPNPRYYDRNRNTAYLQSKTNLILGRMPGAEVP